MILILLIFLLQIKDARWLDGVKWPLADENYRRLPRSSFYPGNTHLPNSKNGIHENSQIDINNALNGGSVEDICDKNELLVRNEMENLGVSSSLINSHIERGARSPIIGTYRILLHRYRNENIT